MMDMYYYIDRQNRQCGPIPYGSLANYGITADTYVWKAGMRGWEKARNLPELQFLCTPTPRASTPQPQYHAQPMAVRVNNHGTDRIRNATVGGWDNNEDSKRSVKYGKPICESLLSIKKPMERLCRNTDSFFVKLLNRFRKNFHKNKEGRNSHISGQEKSAKCPYCGNVVELVLDCMSFQDPVVEKCDHCRCTITYPGTSMITDSGDIIPTWSRKEPIINLGDGEIKLSGKVQESVGWEYKVSVYPEDSFSVNQSITYLHPGMMNSGERNGDEAIVEYSLKPLKPGLSCIREKSYFQGNLKKCLIHYFLVDEISSLPV